MSTRIVGPAAMASSLQQQQQQLHHLQQQAQLHKMPNSSLAPAVAGQTLAGRSPAQKAEASSSTGLDQFPAGLRVLVVDDDVCCLRVVDKMLKSCGYQVTTCPLATKALELLRANKDAYDLVLSDVHMPDMDGFKLLEYVGLEMDLPVIMMSANGDTAQVMKGVTHGACDYLLKPVRLMELKNIWQHVVRKKRNEHKEAEQSSLEEQRRGADDADYTCSINDTADGSWKHSKKRKEAKEEDDDGEQDNDDPSTLKKPRVVWSVELHQQFVGAVNQLGIDKAFPKRILELMNVQGLTRENVASHLQKYRLYLKRLSGVAHQAGGPFGGPADSFVQMNALEGVGDFRAMAASGQLAQLTPQALLQLGRINGGQNGLGLSNMDPMFLHMSGIQAANPGLVARPRLPQSLLNMQPSILQTLPNGLELDALCQPPQMGMGVGQGPMDDGLHALQQQFAATMGPAAAAAANLNGNLTSHQNNGSLMLQLMQQQQQVQGVGGNVNLQPAGLLGPHMLSNGISLGRAGPLPNLATASMGNGGSSMGGGGGGGSRGMCLPPINTGSGMSSALSGLGRSQSMDGKYVSAQPFAAVTGGMSVPSSPAGMVSPSSMKDLSGVLGGMNEKQVRSVGGNFSALGSLSPGLVQNMSANSRPSWHGQEFVQPLNSPRYGQMNTNFNSGLPRGQGFMGQQGVYHGRLSVESSGAISLSEQSTADSEMKIKEERAVDSLFSGKLDAALMSGRDDDLLNMLMKQTPQEPISLSESDFPLDNLYVK